MRRMKTTIAAAAMLGAAGLAATPALANHSYDKHGATIKTVKIVKHGHVVKKIIKTNGHVTKKVTIKKHHRGGVTKKVFHKTRHGIVRHKFKKKRVHGLKYKLKHRIHSKRKKLSKWRWSSHRKGYLSRKY